MLFSSLLTCLSLSRVSLTSRSHGKCDTSKIRPIDIESKTGVFWHHMSEPVDRYSVHRYLRRKEHRHSLHKFGVRRKDRRRRPSVRLHYSDLNGSYRYLGRSRYRMEREDRKFRDFH